MKNKYIQTTAGERLQILDKIFCKDAGEHIYLARTAAGIIERLHPTDLLHICDGFAEPLPHPYKQPDTYVFLKDFSFVDVDGRHLFFKKFKYSAQYDAGKDLYLIKYLSTGTDITYCTAGQMENFINNKTAINATS